MRTCLQIRPNSPLTSHRSEDPLPEEKLAGVVPCQCGKVYVRETQRRLETLVKKTGIHAIRVSSSDKILGGGCATSEWTYIAC